MSLDQPIPWVRWQRRSALVGVAGLAVWLVGALDWHEPAFRAYWFAWVFWAGVGLGSFVLCCLQFVTRGAWSLAVKRPLEAALMTLPLLALLFLPTLLGMRDVFPWARAELFAEAPHKRAYLTMPWFALRTLLYFALLITLTLRIRVWSTREDNALALPQPAGQLRILGAGGLIVYSLGMLIISTDWIMSLEPRWHSTMFVVIVGISQLLTALAAVIAFLILAPTKTGYAALFSTKLRRDLGNLLMAFVVFWTYVSFSQFLIIWSGNLPPEIGWYLHRSSPGWQGVAATLTLLQFALPFALLLSRATKAHPQRLAKVALLVFAMNILNMFWLIVPSFEETTLTLIGLCVPAFIGVGGLWVAVFLRAFQQRSSVPRIALEQKEVAHG